MGMLYEWGDKDNGAVQATSCENVCVRFRLLFSYDVDFIIVHQAAVHLPYVLEYEPSWV